MQVLWDTPKPPLLPKKGLSALPYWHWLKHLSQSRARKPHPYIVTISAFWLKMGRSVERPYIINKRWFCVIPANGGHLSIGSPLEAGMTYFAPKRCYVKFVIPCFPLPKGGTALRQSLGKLRANGNLAGNSRIAPTIYNLQFEF